MKRFLLICTVGMFCVACLSGCPSDSASKVYVVPSNPGTQNGTSWATAYTSIQTAINDAYSHETSTGVQYEVWVKKGQYRESIVMKPGIPVIGNFDGDEVSADDWTMQDPNSTGDPASIISTCIPQPTNGLIHGAAGATLSSFTIDGTGTSLLSAIYNDSLGVEGESVCCCSIRNFSTVIGAGIYSMDSGLTVRYCRFHHNITEQGGAGIWSQVYDDQNPPYSISISASAFDHNTSTLGSGSTCAGQAGGAWVEGECSISITSTTFQSNYACYEGGALRCGSFGGHTATISNCTFLDNAAGKDGAIYASGVLRVEGCLFEGNGCTGAGGVIEGGYDYPLRIYQCVFNRNMAQDGGTIIAGVNTVIVNSVFAQNQARRNGGAIYTYGLTPGPVINSCTFTKNQANTDLNGGAGSAVYVCSGTTARVYNSILYGDFVDEFAGAANITVEHSDIQGGHSGTGNINLNPVFVDAPSSVTDTSFDLHLQASPQPSPCINAALGTHPYSPQDDLGGALRPAGVAPDMGAYECG